MFHWFFIVGEDFWNVPARKVYAVTLGDYEKKKRQEKRGKSAAKKKRKSEGMDEGILEDMAEKIDKLTRLRGEWNLG